ncbi:hypothetical protein DSCOOX_24980 [Desulfosarcina ovata subsp. ovata]|uniref:Uncharacterized protein n=1 Tax=Desulfosarcina ovata subsp. ovata TaxID=2752305 RepID=A0A5K8AA34_9BACT|nr:hypothetical protein DSCOOX_24980 [Desulfosarcina ovata subsp. ovata]
MYTEITVTPDWILGTLFEIGAFFGEQSYYKRLIIETTYYFYTLSLFTRDTKNTLTYEQKLDKKVSLTRSRSCTP